MQRWWRLTTALLVTGMSVTACADKNPYQAARDQAAAVSTTVVNDFVPTQQDLSNCIGAVERPDCGSDSKGGWRMTLVFGVLVAGMGFVFWRITRSVRARDRVVNDLPT